MGAIADFVEGILHTAGADKYPYAKKAEDLYEKRLRNGDKEIIFLFNNAETEKTIDLEGEVVSCGGDGMLSGKAWTIPANGMGYAVVKN